MIFDYYSGGGKKKKKDKKRRHTKRSQHGEEIDSKPHFWCLKILGLEADDTCRQKRQKKRQEIVNLERRQMLSRLIARSVMINDAG